MTRKMDIGLLRSLLRYDADTGLLFWKPRSPELFINDSKHRRWSNRCADKPALAGKNFHGYRQGKILGQLFQAHRVIWALHYGEWPDGEVDHINGIRSDNRIENLRCVDPTQNSRNARRPKNNTSGVLGVGRFKSGGWRAHIGMNGKQTHIGTFPTKDEAIAARKAAEIKLGYHPNHGKAP